MKDDGLEICCGVQYCDRKTGIWKVSYDKIECMDYYKITSFLGWLSLYSYCFPKCVFITVHDCFGQDESVFIGYMDLVQAREIASIGNLQLIVH